MPPHNVMRIVGHATLGVTMGIYASAALDEQRALHLGMRRAELLGLPWDAVDLVRGVLEWVEVDSPWARVGTTGRE